VTPLPYSDGCFVCGHENPAGLGLRFRAEHDEVVADFVLPSHFRGFLDRTHGGIASALVDEAMGWATVLRSDRFTYTAELVVRFREPVPLETPLQVRARVVRHTRRLSFAEGEILDAESHALIRASGKFAMVGTDESREIAGLLIYEPGAWRLGRASHAASSERSPGTPR